MTNPTRQEINKAQLARQWAEQVQKSDAEYERKGRRYSGDPMRAAAEYILSQIPAPTMAEVEWDDKRHFLAVVDVDHEVYKKAIMLKQNVYDATIQCFALHPHKCVVCNFGPAFLTPTGERYTYTEAQDG